MDEDFFECWGPLIEAIKRDLANGTFPSIKPTDDFYKFMVEQVQAAIAKTGAIDVEEVVRLGVTQFCINKLEADGKLEKTMRADPETGEMHLVYRARLPN